MNRFICTKCRMIISKNDLISADMIHTRHGNSIHTFCPICNTHIVSFSSDKYEETLNNLTKCFNALGCKILCYYEGSVEQGKNTIDYKPPIFRIIDTDDKLFYRLACKIKNVNNEYLDDIFINDENDGSFSIIGGTETWYFDTITADKDRNIYLCLMKKIISMLIRYGKKYKDMEDRNE